MHPFTYLTGLFALAAGLALSTLATAAEDKEKGTSVKINSRSSTAPADWKSEKPKYTLRSYQFKVPGAKDHADGKITVYPESAKDVQKNFSRWKAQFELPEGKTADDISKVSKLEIPGLTVNLLNVSGTWKFKEAPQDPKSKEKLLEDYRVVWVIITDKEDTTHIRFSGPQPTVEKNYEGFVAWLKGLK